MAVWIPESANMVCAVPRECNRGWGTKVAPQHSRLPQPDEEAGGQTGMQPHCAPCWKWWLHGVLWQRVLYKIPPGKLELKIQCWADLNGNYGFLTTWADSLLRGNECHQLPASPQSFPLKSSPCLEPLAPRSQDRTEFCPQPYATIHEDTSYLIPQFWMSLGQASSTAQFCFHFCLFTLQTSFKVSALEWGKMAWG
jgi:hypothetical protein